jgi:hypothetical protein
VVGRSVAPVSSLQWFYEIQTTARRLVVAPLFVVSDSRARLRLCEHSAHRQLQHNLRVEIASGVLATESAALLKDFFAPRR